MKIADRLVFPVVLAVLLVLAGESRAASPETVPGEHIVLFRPYYTDAMARRLAAKASPKGLEAAERRKIRARRASAVKRIGKHTYLVRSRRHAKRLRISGAIVSPNFVHRALAVPDDTHYSLLWGLSQANDIDINGPEAWDLTVGPPANVVVGVIDTGIDYTHPDLAPNMWTNPLETPGNGIDDDGNGYIDDVYGINAISGSGDPMDDHYHGTHCAGTIGAVGNNGEGVTGVNWSVRLMGLKFLGANGSGTTSDAIESINYFADIVTRDNLRGITNNSWGGGGFSIPLKTSIEAARDAGILFVAAAGNDNLDNDVTPHYPSNYTVSNVISVAAIGSNGSRAGFSNYGATTVHIAAPGVSILSTYPGNDYAYLSGTSMATPHVAGVAAMILAIHPELSVTGLREHLLLHRKTIPALSGLMVNAGIPDLAAALENAPGTPTPTPTATATATATATPTNTPAPPVPTATQTPTPTNTPTPQPTFTFTPTPQPTFTFTPTRTPTAPPTNTSPPPTATNTPAATSTAPPSATATPVSEPIEVSPGIVPDPPGLAIGQNRHGMFAKITLPQQFQGKVKYKVTLVYADGTKRVRVTSKRNVVFQNIEPGQIRVKYKVQTASGPKRSTKSSRAVSSSAAARRGRRG